MSFREWHRYTQEKRTRCAKIRSRTCNNNIHLQLSKYKEEFELIWASVGCVSRLRRKITLFKQNKKKTDVTRLSTYAHDSRKRFQINPFFKILLNLAMGKEFSIWIGKSVCGLDGGMSFKVNYILLPPNYLAFRFEVFFFIILCSRTLLSPIFCYFFLA